MRDDPRQFRVYFYDITAMRGRTLKWWQWIWLGMQWVVLRGGYLHCNIEQNGRLYQCDRWTRLMVPTHYRMRPSRTVVMVTADPAWRTFVVGQKATRIRTALHVLGFPVDRSTIVNCVQVSARLLGVTRSVRTPNHLLKAIQSDERSLLTS